MAKDLKCYTRKKKDGGKYTTCLGGQAKDKKKPSAGRSKIKITSFKPSAGRSKKKLVIVPGKVKDLKGYAGAEASVKRAFNNKPAGKRPDIKVTSFRPPKPNVTKLTERLKPRIGYGKNVGVVKSTGGLLTRRHFGTSPRQGVMENPKTYLYDSGINPNPNPTLYADDSYDL